MSQPAKLKLSGSTFKNPINQTDKKVWNLIEQVFPKKQIWCDYLRETC